jgi:ubiquinone/menaquinone biosynthesis C-methylase UbiE
MLEFDAPTARLLERGYQGADVIMRRRGSFDAVNPGPGETIVDIGCGNGLLTAELARAVGADGRVFGVDPSNDMRQSAIERCQEYEWVEVIEGSAGDLPLASDTIDKAVSVQVFEYLDDLSGAVKDTHRVLKPGGKLVIGDIHFDSLIWFSRVPERMVRMIEAWDHHFVERTVPALLPSILKRAGFALESIRPITICDYQLKPDGLANMMLILMEKYAIDNGHMHPDEATEWVQEQRDLAAAGEFFFSVTHFVTSAYKI